MLLQHEIKTIKTLLIAAYRPEDADKMDDYCERYFEESSVGSSHRDDEKDGLLISAFTWSRTPEGFEYWSDVDATIYPDGFVSRLRGTSW